MALTTYDSALSFVFGSLGLKSDTGDGDRLVFIHFVCVTTITATTIAVPTMKMIEMDATTAMTQAY